MKQVGEMTSKQVEEQGGIAEAVECSGRKGEDCGAVALSLAATAQGPQSSPSLKNDAPVHRLLVRVIVLCF